jgi:hypothetical protein
LTSVFKGTNPDKDNFTNPASHEEYPPFFFSAIKQKKVKEPSTRHLAHPRRDS